MKLKVHVFSKETWQGIKTQPSSFISQGDLHPLIHINSAPLNFWATKQQTPCLFSPADSHSTLPGVVQASQSSLAFDSGVEEEIKKFILIIAPELKISEVKSNIQVKYSKLYPHAQNVKIEYIKDMEGFDLDPDYLVKEVFRDNDSLIAVTTPSLPLSSLEASSVEEPIRKKSKMDENNFYQSIMMATKTPSRQPSLVTPIEPRGSSSVDETDDFSTDSQSSNSSADDSDDTALKGEQGEKQESTSEEDGRSSESEDSEDNKSVALEDTVATLTDPEYSSSDNEGEESEEEEGVIVETVVSSSGKLLDMSERYPQDDSTDLSEEDSESTSSSSPESEDELSNAVPSVQSLTLEKVKPHIVVRKRTPSPTLSDHTNLPENRHVVFERPVTRSSARTNLLQPTPVSFKAPLASIPDEKENTIKKKTSYTSALFK